MAKQQRPARPRRPRPDPPTPPKRALHKMVTHKPFCSPSRPIITAALNKHGVTFHYFEEKILQSAMKDIARRMKIEEKRRENLKYGPMAAMYLPMAIEATFYVSKEQAGWAEYLLERTQHLMVVKGGVDKRNRGWADQHEGVMPTPWDEPGCKEGQQVLKNLQATLKVSEAEKKGKPKQGRKGKKRRGRR